eukprot:Nitzschia sp. Nitz4//scaffold216_size36101//23908//25674//NITZ4_007783-RA/size36101-processed-gene-0.5-mRNA-1//1//CDS//3329542200//3409//frame0
MTNSTLRRRRKLPIEANDAETNDSLLQENALENHTPLQHHASFHVANLLEEQNQNSTTWLVTKWTILRLTGFIYFVAFMGAYYQNQGLMGSDGLQPATDFFTLRLQPKFADPSEGFLSHPTLFWFIDLNDDNLDAVYKSGIALSVLMILGVDSMLVTSLLWLLYFSIVTVAGGSAFYNYGWESQLLETGFLCIFLCDFFPGARSPPSPIVLWLFRWLCFRVSMGAGLIKIRGDSCWTEKTCLHYHFETQPIPSPLSFLFHFLPKWMLTRAVDLDLFVQVYSSWMVLCPTSLPGVPLSFSQLLRSIVRIGGVIQAGFMVNILLSGNFAFLNHLTIIPALACLDDHMWPRWLKRQIHQQSVSLTFSWKSPRILLSLGLLWLIGSLSQPVVENLLQVGGTRQQMNASFGSFRLVNTYGAFGSVGQARYEAIVSVTYNGKDWIELEFPCKPGSIDRRPCFCAPYHYRVDWNIWFIGFKPHDRMLHGRETWMFALLTKLLDKDVKERPWLALLDSSSANLLRGNYESKFMTPLYAKVDMYHYRMAAPLWEILPNWIAGEPVIWWNRTLEEVLIPPVRQDKERQRLVLAEDIGR